MEIFGENLWLTILFWLVIVIIIALLIFCCVSHFIKKGEQQEEQKPWYITKAIIEPTPNCCSSCNAKISLKGCVGQTTEDRWLKTERRISG